MKKYLTIAKSTWQEYLTYRLNLFLETFGNILLMLVVIALWLAVYKSSGQGIIGGYLLNEMITYLIVGSIIQSFLWITVQGDEMADDILYGNFSNFLTKPFSIILYHYARDWARKFVTLFLSFFVFIVILIFAKEFFVLPEAGWQWFGFFIALIIASSIHFLLFFMFSLGAFWMEQAWGLTFLLRVVFEVAAGLIIPLSLFSSLWQKIFLALPFRFMIYDPVIVFLGKISFSGFISHLIFGLIWIFILLLIIYFLWRKGIKHYSAVGG